MRILVDLLDFSDPFQKILLRILEIGEEHVSGSVPAGSVDTARPHIAQLNDDLQ